MTVPCHNEVIVFLNSFLAHASPVFLSVNPSDHFVAAHAPPQLPKFQENPDNQAANSLRNNQFTFAAPSTMTIRQ